MVLPIAELAGTILICKKKIVDVCSCLLLRFTATGNVCCSFSAGSSLVADDALPPGGAVRAVGSVPSGPSRRACVLFLRGAVGGL